MSLAIELVVLLAAGTALILLAMLIADYPRLGFIAVGAGVVLNMDFPTWPTIASAAGFSVSYADLVAVTLTAAGLMTFLRSGRPVGQAVGGPAVLIGLIFIGVAAGTFHHGFATAVNEARGILSIAAVCFWIFTLQPARPEVRRWIEVWALVTAGIVTVRGLYNIAVHGLGNALTGDIGPDGEVLAAGRPMASTQAFIIAFAALVAFSRWQNERKRIYLFSTFAFTAMVILAQHRSVWAALAVGAVWFIATMEIGNRLVVIVCVVLAGGVLLLLVGLGVGGNVVSLLSESATNTATYDGRLYDWALLIDRSFQAGPGTVLLGFPYGEGWVRVREDGVVLPYAPHNFYVSSYLRLGVVGLVVVAIIVLGAIARNIRLQNDPPLATLIVMIAVFCWAYNFTWLLAPMLAWAIWGGKNLAEFDEARETVSPQVPHAALARPPRPLRAGRPASRRRWRR